MPDFVMSANRKPIYEALMDWLAMRWTALRAGLSTPLESGPEADLFTHPDQQRWAEGDPMVTQNPASLFGRSEAGHHTRSGHGSLEVGASQEWRVGG
jgi:hypothetical protein